MQCVCEVQKLMCVYLDKSKNHYQSTKTIRMPSQSLTRKHGTRRKGTIKTQKQGINTVDKLIQGRTGGYNRYQHQDRGGDRNKIETKAHGVLLGGAAEMHSSFATSLNPKNATAINGQDSKRAKLAVLSW